MQKIRFLTALLTVLVLLALTGCGNINNSENTGETASVTESKQTVTPSPIQSETPEVSPADETGFEVGNVMPDFSVPMVDGGTFTLSENLGKPVFINVFATWCGPCVGEMPEIDKLYGEFGSEVTFIEIDLGENDTTAKDFAESNSYSLPFAYSLDGAPFGSVYAIDFIPQTFVLSADGTIMSFFGGASDYEGFKAAIEEALAQ